MLRRQKTVKRPESEIAFIGNIYWLLLVMSRRTNVAIKINKTRRRAFNEYYEVNWRKLNSKDGSDQDLSELNEYVTLERFDVIEANFPNLLKEYQDMIEAKKSFRSNFTIFMFILYN